MIFAAYMALIKRFPKSINYTRVLLILWIVISVFAGLKQYLKGSYNNYLIFKHVFINTLNKINLYTPQPEYYFDNNHYGPFFSLVIAPFALMPDLIGVVLWAVLTSLVLFAAISKLPVTTKKRYLILLICTDDLYT